MSEVDAALTDAFEARRRETAAPVERFFEKYHSTLVKVIKPTLTDFTTNTTVKLQILLTRVSGDARVFALIVDLGKEGEHRLEFSPDFMRERVTVSVVSPYGKDSCDVIDLSQVTAEYVAAQGAKFLAPFLNLTL
jgi:hypothetical protein